MKALSIRQPWAWAILFAGKRLENRDWSDRYPSMHVARRLMEAGEPFLLHASKGMTVAERDGFRNFYVGLEVDHKMKLPRLPMVADLRRGGIVGQARIVEIVWKHDSPWFFGPFALVLDDVEELPFVPFKGAQGFFNVPDTLLRAA